MRKGICLLLLLLLLLPMKTVISKEDQMLMAAFIREDNLWMKEGTQEKQITTEKNVASPNWSYDGKWISYRKKEEIWIYDVTQNRHYRIYQSGGDSVQWAPDKNVLAFTDDGILNVVDVRGEKPCEFENVALGVDYFAWLPDGKGFLASSSANLLPDGWTNPILYKIALKDDLSTQDLTKNVQKFFIVPNPVKKENTEVLSIQAFSFKWSHDGKWISFFVTPTASLSMDSNMLCVLSSNGKVFQPIGEMLHNPDWVQWGPENHMLGYIAGEGRMPFGFQNKKLTIQQMPVFPSKAVTSKNFVDLDFTWQNKHLITVSSLEVSNKSAVSAQKLLPALYQWNLTDGTQRKLTNPPAGFGDSNPLFLPRVQKLTWLRSNEKNRDAWISLPNGEGAMKWIEHVQDITWYQQGN